MKLNLLIDDVCKERPEAVAVKFGARAISFGELNKSISIVGRVLSKVSNLNHGNVLAVKMELTPEYVITICGILKSGYAFCPIGNDTPPVALAQLLSTLKPALLIHDVQSDTQTSEALGVASCSYESLIFGSDGLQGGANIFLSADRKIYIDPDLAHVVFTSGSTGVPKAVLGSHSAMVNRLQWLHTQFPLESDDILGTVRKIGFIDSVTDIFTAICSGITLAIVTPDSLRDFSLLGDQLKQMRVTRLGLIPSVLRAILRSHSSALDQIKILFSSGESLNGDLALKILLFSRGIRLVNLYGSTESTGDIAFHEYTIEGCESIKPENSIIGRHIANCHIAVCGDSNYEPLFDCPGEICVSGVGICLGFVDFSGQRTTLDAHTDWLRTGDKGIVSDFGIMYLGRLSNELKIRGHKVVPEEVEHFIRSFGAIEAVLVPYTTAAGNCSLAAFVQLRKESMVSAVTLREYCQAELHESKVPSRFVIVDDYPKTPTGKIDRSALLSVDADVSTRSSNLEHFPNNGEKDVVRSMAEIWCAELSLPTVNMTDNFFVLGGDSIIAASVVYRTRHDIRREVNGSLLYANPVLQDFIAAVKMQPALGEHLTLTWASKYVNENGNHHPCSHMQTRLWLLSKKSTVAYAYNIPLMLEFGGFLDEIRFESAYLQVIKRHQILNSKIVVGEDGTLLQVNLPLQSFAGVAHRDLRYDMHPKSVLTQEALVPLNSEVDCLTKATLFRTGDESWTLVAVFHHAIFDGASVDIFIRDLLAFYIGDPLGPALQYHQYVHWHLQERMLQQVSRQAEFWSTHLDGAEPVIDLPYEYTRHVNWSGTVSSVSIILPQQITIKLREFAKSHSIHLYSILVVVFGLLLRKLSGQRDVCILTPTCSVTPRRSDHRRVAHQYEGTSDTIGLFVNTLVSRVVLNDEESTTDVAIRQNKALLEMIDNLDVPFEDIVAQSLPPEVERNQQSPFTQVILSYFKKQRIQIEPQKFSVKHTVLDTKRSAFDIAMLVEDDEDVLECSLDLRSDCFHRDSASKWGDRFTKLLNDSLNSPQMPIGKIDCIPKDEQELLQQWAQGTTLVAQIEPQNASTCSIWRRVLAQARKTPNNIALVATDDSLNYEELIEAVQKRMSFLVDQGVTPLDRIAISMPPSIASILWILAILGVGSTYVPIDPNFPQDRKNLIILDCQAKFVLTRQPVHAFPDSCVAFNVDEESINSNTMGQHNPDAGSSCCVILYTSGTTGKPKGVELETCGMLMYLEWLLAYFNVTENDILFHSMSHSFDGSFAEMFCGLICGASVFVSRAALHDPNALLDTMKISNATLAIGGGFVPSVLSSVLQIGTIPKSFRHIQVGGESVTNTLIRTFYGKCENLSTDLHATYGPSEVSVVTTVHLCQRLHDYSLSRGNCIGRPIDGRLVYVVDDTGSLCPLGVIGELYIGGGGLFKGYHNNAQLTQESFVESEQGRLYKSGDLVRFDVSGTLWFCGRRDTQIKLRGVRIELEEIERSCTSLDGVENSAAVLLENETLAVYIATSSLTQHQVMRHCQQSLPNAMCPSRVVILPSLPITTNGKVDKRTLLKFGDGAPQNLKISARTFETPLEQKICEAYAYCLSLEAANVQGNDDFFLIGGHSLLVFKLTAAVKSMLSLHLDISEVFSCRSPERIAELLASREQVNSSTDTMEHYLLSEDGRRAIQCKECQASYAQERMVFMSELHREAATYNLPFSMTICGNLDEKSFLAAYQSLAERQQSLRTTLYIDSVGQVCQKVGDSASTTMSFQDLREDPNVSSELTAITNELVSSAFDLSVSTTRAKLCRTAESKWVFIFVAHHAVFDGASLSTFMRELDALYHGRDLPPLKTNYIQYSFWQRNLMSQALRVQQHVTFWREKLRDIQTESTLPLDFSVPSHPTFEGARHEFTVEAHGRRCVSEFAKKAEVSEFVVLLSVFGMWMMKHIDHQREILIGTPQSTRGLSTELQNVIGLLVNSMPLCVSYTESDTFLDVVRRTQKFLSQALDHAELPFDMIVQNLNIERNPDRTPLFQHMFAFDYEDEQHSSMFSDAELASSDTISTLFDLTLFTVAGEHGYDFVFEYRTEMFASSTIHYFEDRFVHLLQAAMQDPMIRVNDISIMSAKEYAQVTTEFNNTDAVFPCDMLVHQLVLESCLRYAEKVAICHHSKNMTYRELHSKVLVVARKLQLLGAQADSRIAICMCRSPDMLLAILGILVAGAAFVPIEPVFPEQRIGFILADSGCDIVITDSAIRARLTHLVSSGTTLLTVDSIDFAVEPSGVLTTLAQPNTLAYVMYTSGTTGNPKGVMIEHLGFTNHIWHMAHRVFEPDDVERTLLSTSLCFDQSITELFVPLILGGKQIVVENIMELSAIKATCCVTTPSAIAAIDNLPTSIRVIVLGGEPTPPSLLTRLYDELPHLRGVWNSFGPTEVTDMCTIPKWGPGDDPVAGPPMPNVKTYVLNETLSPVPIGVPGQLCVAGVGVARGYLNLPQLTRQKFVANPFGSGKLYLTGDIVAWRSDGQLDYFGRSDTQVKIKGHRVELEEIKQKILLFSDFAFQDATVVYRKHGNGMILLAFVCPVVSDDMITSLRAYLEEVLPGPMIPQAITCLHSLPRNSNDKIDQAQLHTSIRTVSMGPEYNTLEPVTVLEHQMATVLQAFDIVLGLNMDLDSDFFSSGGHSLLAMKLVSRIQSAFPDVSVDLHVSKLFRYRTPRQLAHHMFSGTRSAPVANNPIVCLNAPSDNSTTLLFCPGADGQCWSFRKITDLMACRCLGAVIEKETPLNTVGDMADFFCEALLVILQQDNISTRYIGIVGYSFGCRLAFEIALKLQDRGYTSAVVLVDGYNNMGRGTCDIRQLVQNTLLETAARQPAQNIDQVPHEVLQHELRTTEFVFSKCSALAAHYVPSGVLLGPCTLISGACKDSADVEKLFYREFPYISLGPDISRILPDVDHYSMLSEGAMLANGIEETVRKLHKTDRIDQIPTHPEQGCCTAAMTLFENTVVWGTPRGRIAHVTVLGSQQATFSISRLCQRDAPDKSIRIVNPIAEKADEAKLFDNPTLFRKGACHWPAIKTWTFENFCSGALGETMVQIVPDGTNCTERMSLSRYITSFKNQTPSSQPPPYLRGWRFEEDHPRMLQDIRIPNFVQDALLRLPRNARPPLRWIFVGPAGAKTRTHVDPFMVDSWITQIQGRKKFILVSPEDTDKVCDEHGFTDLTACDTSRFPLIDTVSLMEVILEPGDVLHIPEGWIHEVVCLEDCITFTADWVRTENFAPVALAYAAKLAYSGHSTERDDNIVETCRSSAIFQRLRSPECLNSNGAICTAHDMNSVHMDMQGCHIGTSGISVLLEALQRTPALQHLNLASNQVNDECLVGICHQLQCSTVRLTSIDLRYNGITSASLTNLCGLVHLEELWIAHNELGTAGGDLLADIALSCPKLVSLDCGRCGLGNSVFAMIERIAETSVRVLDCSFNMPNRFPSTLQMGTLKEFGFAGSREYIDVGIGVNGISQLIISLRFKFLVTLNLFEIDLTGFGKNMDAIRSLAHCISCSCNLKNVCLYSTNLGDSGVQILIPAITTNASLQRLDLSYNALGDISAECLAQYLAHNAVLRDLLVDDNDIGRLGLLSLCYSVTYNDTLRDLSVLGNNVSAGLYRLLTLSLKSNDAAPSPQILTDIDVSPLISNPESDAAFMCALRIVSSVREKGMFRVVLSEKTATTVTAAFHQSRAFFSLPHSEKAKYSMNQSEDNYRGWFPVPDAEGSDKKEGLDIGFERYTESGYMQNHLLGINPFGAECLDVELQATLRYLNDDLFVIATGVMRGFAVGMGYAPNFFEKHFQSPMATLRVLHYPPVASEIRGVHVCGEHFDYGFITILANDDVPGLQRCKDGEWYDVPPKQNTLAVNVGLLMTHWTSGFVPSVYHRVHSTHNRDRMSAAFFVSPDANTMIKPLCDLVPKDSTPKESCTSLDWLSGNQAWDVEQTFGHIL